MHEASDLRQSFVCRFVLYHIADELCLILQVNGSASAAGGQPLHALAMLSKHPALYPEIYPGFLQKTEVLLEIPYCIRNR